MMISRDEALARIKFRVRHTCPEANGDNVGECDGCWRYPCNDMKAVIFLTQERPHGEWDTDFNRDNATVCSECGEKAWYKEYRGWVTKSNFCPNCGADMREGDENDSKP